MLDSRKSGLLAAVSLLAMGAGALERSRIEAAFRRGSGFGYFKGWKYPPKKPWGGSVKRHARAMAKQRRAAR